MPRQRASQGKSVTFGVTRGCIAVASPVSSITTSAGGSWNGKAEFTLSADHRHLTGRIQSKRGDDIPVTLNRV
jgi:hypothetical protein